MASIAAFEIFRPATYIINLSISGKDVSPAMFVVDESSHITSLLSVAACVASLNSDAKLFATVVAVKRGVGGGLFRGELRFHAKTDGTAPGL